MSAYIASRRSAESRCSGTVPIRGTICVRTVRSYELHVLDRTVGRIDGSQ
jgi:hypothetical protein